MPEAEYPKDFPNLKSDYIRTSEPADYNCISFALGDIKKWWWPSVSEDEYWPLPIPDKINLDTFANAFATLGYFPCVDGSPDRSCDKIALYGIDADDIRHAAKLESTWTRWESKLGAYEDIEHDLSGLEGPCFGKVLMFFSKPII